MFYGYKISLGLFTWKNDPNNWPSLGSFNKVDHLIVSMACLMLLVYMLKVAALG